MRNPHLSIKSIAITIAFATSCLSTPTYALAIFGVNEGSVPGTPSNTFSADRINGSYNEVLTFTGANTFTAKTVFSLGSFTLSNGGAVVSYLNNPEPNGYAEYGMVTSSGTFVLSGSDFSFNATSNTVELFIDPNSDTAVTLPGKGTGDIIRTSFADDLRIMSDFNGIGAGSVDSSKPNPGNFAILFNHIVLDPIGNLYFPSPSPFYVDFQVNGNLNPAPVTDPILQQGVANLFFSNSTVPEPASLALLGIGFFVMAATMKRRRDLQRNIV